MLKCNNCFNNKCVDCNIIKKYSDQLYCLDCDDYTKHRQKYPNTLSCIACSNTRQCITVYNPNENKINTITCFCVMAKINYNNCKKICIICDKNNIEFQNAYYNCTINGINNICLDIYRPMCSDCHHKMCHNTNHELCMDKEINNKIKIKQNAKL